ncbi:trypsin-like peptidase domain-containing protein [Streptomyces sp. NPDC058246]|uniref:trypsin-like peptidase domain-containing protein n=1 Tax=Streptomyces sp. NPDC058246 TaxID=3346400 RepID=UPI0036ED97CF
MTRSALVDALSDAVLALRGADGAEGSGFFVGPGLVLTCAHVVGSADAPVTARWRGRELSLTAEPEWFRPTGPDGSGADLALLRAPEGLDHPVVCLAEAIEPGDDLWSHGHPQGPYRDGDAVSFTAQGPSRRAHQGGSVALYHATHGRAAPGFSGAPVINWRTGAVCGVLRFAHSLERGVPGARLIPVQTLLETYDVLDEPGAVTPARRAWMDLLDDAQLRAGGWRYAGPALRAYLEAARAAADDHPYAVRVPGAVTPPLAEVYVSQHVSPQGAVEPHADLGDAPLLPADSLITEHARVVVVGGPGAGKSSLSRRLTARLADTWLAGGQPHAVPVRVRADALAQPGYLSDLLRTAVERDPAIRLRTPLPRDMFEGPPLPGVPWLVLVDGVDEVLDPVQRKTVLDTVASLCRTPEFHILVTTRPLSREELEPLLRVEAPVFRMQPFGLNVLREFANQWLHSLRLPEAETLTDRFLQATERSHMLHLAGIPLLATMLVVIFAERPDSPLPRGRIELYEQFVDRLLEKMHRPPTLALEGLRARVKGYPDAPEAVSELVKRVRGLLEQLAGHRQRIGGQELSMLELAVRETAELRPGHLPEDEWRQVVGELLRRTGLMTGEGDDLAFLHQTVQEFLAARLTARTTEPATSAGRAVVSGVSEDWRVRDFPEENAYVEFVFGLWAKYGMDAGDLVLSLFGPGPVQRHREAHARAAQSARTAATHHANAMALHDAALTDEPAQPRQPGQATGLVARLLHDKGSLPARVLPQMLTRLRVAALDYGCAWAAGALVYADRAEGLALLENMATAPRLAAHERLAALWELAAWDRDRAVALLRGAVATGMSFAGRTTQRREVRDTTTYFYDVPAGPQAVVTSRFDAAGTLGLLEHALGVEAFTSLVCDDSLSLGDRLRAAMYLSELLPELRTLPAPPLIAGRDVASLRGPEILVEAATAENGRDPARLLTEWALDRTRSGEERVTAAQALVLHDARQARAVLEQLVRKPELNHDPDTAEVAGLLAELDRGRAVRALKKRIGEDTFHSAGPEVVDALARISPRTAAKVLRREFRGRNFFRPPAHHAYTLAQVDRKAGEKALLAMVRDSFNSSERWESARLLARVNRQLAIAEIKAVLASDKLVFDIERSTAQRVLNELESPRTESSALESGEARSRPIEPSAKPPRALPAGPTTQ